MPNEQTPRSRPTSESARGSGAQHNHFIAEINKLKTRLAEEAQFAVGMVESALEALWTADRAAAAEVRERDDRIDLEEVAIEEACFGLMALHQPVARDFRKLAFILKANGDIERVADHACSIAKVTRKLSQDESQQWPTALRELGERVPRMCQTLLRALRNEDAQAARQILSEDESVDRIHKQLFQETVSLMKAEPTKAAFGLNIYRVGRDLERIGDLMTNIAEDLVYLTSGDIVRHEKKLKRAQAARGSSTE